MNKFKVGDRVAMIDHNGSIKKGFFTDEYPRSYSAKIDYGFLGGLSNIIGIPKDKLKPIIKIKNGVVYE